MPANLSTLTATRPDRAVTKTGGDIILMEWHDGQKTATKKRAAKKTTKKAPRKPTKQTARKTPTRAAEEAAQAARTWMVWQDATGIWVGIAGEFKRSKWRDTIVCDVFDGGNWRERNALRLAVQLAQALRQTYADCVQRQGQQDSTGQWLQYDDAAQEQRVKEWEERLKDMGQ
jgi:hypothetical protein